MTVERGSDVGGQSRRAFIRTLGLAGGGRRGMTIFNWLNVVAV